MHTSHTILITGVSGFVGHHLARELKAQAVTVYGTGLSTKLGPELSPFVDKYFGDCDLTKPESVAKLPLQEVTAIINLAGLAQVGGSFSQEDLYMQTNLAVHTVLAQRLLDLDQKTTRLVAISTGAVYDSNSPMPLKEASPLVTTAGSPYARSKVAMEAALANYRQKGLDIIIARPFNHIGPGQKAGFIIPDLVEQLVTQKTATVGNLRTERDYTDVRDVVKAYVLLATKAKLSHHIYNVCSGKSKAGQVILDLLKTALGKESTAVRVDKSRFRPGDPAKITGDNTRITADTGWRPQIAIEQTIADVVASL